MPPLDEFALTGRRREHVIDSAAVGCTLQPSALQAFIAMQRAASESGISLAAASSFRDFDRQLIIWNAKYRGERPLFDRHGHRCEASQLSDEERIEAILAWSALPGASRHHWGTDLDVFDAAALTAGATLQLVPEEYADGGPFARLSAWLETHMHRFGFYRPYVASGCGVSPEPWHLSYVPLAAVCLRQLTPGLLRGALVEAPLAGRETVLARLDELHERFVLGVAPPPASLVDELGDHRRMV